MRQKKKSRWAADLSLSPPSSSSASASSSSSSSSGDGGRDAGEKGGDDRLTELPDTVRLHILSLLPLKYAIRTGALSSRWRALWRLRWPHPAALEFSPPTDLGDSASDEFVAGVDRCLSARGLGRRIDALFVALPPGRRYDADIKRWLEYAASCGVEDLSLVVSPLSLAATSARPGRRARRNDRAAVSSAFFFSISECSSLARLTISGLHLSSPSANIKRLSSLEVLSLQAAHVTDAALRRIIAACPFLRSLDLCLCRKLRRIMITAASSRLTSLTIVGCVRALEVTISSAGLRRFRFSGNYLTTYSFDSPSRLEDVYISSGSPVSSLPRSNWVKALGELSNVKVLTLCNLSLQYIVAEGVKAIGEFRNFRNLRELQLLMGMMTDDNLMDIYGFFRLCQCPRLEKLFIELPTNMGDPFIEKYLVVSEEEPPEVDFEYLKMIKINSFKGHSNEICLVKFLLGKAGSLESLVMISPKELIGEQHNKNILDGCPDFLHFLQSQLLSFTRASVGAQIILSEHDDNKFSPTHWEVYSKV
ncbi:unnamed protein product [Musa acuminata subsp. malaccensis]|uniref:(wild Malaysian banana) hypothetical protein n=1 Tax=Musa acuminata subsp. malaccensis TaxID=214687 RepID=A0A804LBG4_MUSAM|nr:PREDICTED: F-box/LRR-repeat protein At3g03360 [Musa acuminata subsp. malaccensis]CAG1865544.1 unnamed protein product [Musa acuminata subsp. malaccensis]